MRRIVLIIIAVIVLAYAWSASRQPAESGIAADSTSEIASVPPPKPAALPAFLPSEAHRMVERIQHGGPFAYPQDGAVFGNREKLLPHQPRGYYREYTVVTPGLKHRGARRIVTGGTPPGVWYYTDDHYRHFRRFEVAR